jgi:peptidoglycan hydrolase CwlO-like protein
MSIAKCNKCGGTLFQTEVIMPVGSPREILSIICNSCSSLLAATEYFSAETGLEEIKSEFEKINKKLDVINSNIGQLMSGVQTLYKKVDGKSN